MIHIIYSGICLYNRKLRGLAEHTIAYDGTCPLRAAQRWADRPAQRVDAVRIHSVVKDGTVYLNELH